MATSSQNATPTSCFSSVFRRLLCAGGLPTHPSTDNQTTTTTTDHHLFKTDSSFKLQSPSPTRTTTIPAGVVARLMGLDSFPNPTSTTPSTKVSLGTIMMRSRSAGSLDFLPNFHIKKQPHHHHHNNNNSLHRRVRTSLSFRELPTFFETTSHNHHHHHHHHHAHGKSEMGFTPKLQETSKNNSKKGIRREREKKITNKKGQSQNQSMKVIKNEEKEVSLNYRRKKKVVVIDDGFPEEQKKKKKYKSRKRTYNHPLPKMVKHETKAKKQSMMLKRRESEYSEEYCVKVLVDVCRLTMEEINGGFWVDAKVDKNLQETISYEVGQEILQLLVYELVDELCSSI